MSTTAALAAIVLTVLVGATSLPDERRRVLRCVAALFVGWVWYVSSWTTYSPSILAYRGFGVYVSSVDLWSGMDAIIGIYVLTLASDRAWGIALFVLYAVQVVCHLSVKTHTVDVDQYRLLLDVTFCGQIACLLIGGSPRAANRSDRHDAWFRLGMVETFRRGVSVDRSAHSDQG